MTKFEIRRKNILDQSELEQLDAICVTTNGIVKSNGELVMGAGVALAFKNKYPTLPKDLGSKVKGYGNKVHYFHNSPFIVSFPTKHDWKNPSDMDLIINSAKELQNLIDVNKWMKVGLPCPGARNGGLSVDESLNLLDGILDPSKVIIYIKD